MASFLVFIQLLNFVYSVCTCTCMQSRTPCTYIFIIIYLFNKLIQVYIPPAFSASSNICTKAIAWHLAEAKKITAKCLEFDMSV